MQPLRSIATAVDPHLTVRITGADTDWTAEFDRADTAAGEFPEVLVTKVSGGAAFEFQQRQVAAVDGPCESRRRLIGDAEFTRSAPDRRTEAARRRAQAFFIGFSPGGPKKDKDRPMNAKVTKRAGNLRHRLRRRRRAGAGHRVSRGQRRR